jgi:hypothetical protein
MPHKCQLFAWCISIFPPFNFLVRSRVSAASYGAEKTGQVIMRGTDGISGSATFTVNTEAGSLEQISKALSYSSCPMIYLVQALQAIDASPNILVFVEPDPGGVEVVGVSDQRLNQHLKHIGNITPSIASTLADVTRSAEIFSRWLQTAGYSGLVGSILLNMLNERAGRSGFFLQRSMPG